MISETSKYALRALIELVRCPQGETMRGQDLAKAAHVPPLYLAKIMLTLRKAGYISATRGAGGGYCLLKPAETIPLIEVVELFDGAAARPQCFLGINDKCDPARPCSAHAAWTPWRNAYVEFLERTKLSDVATAPEKHVPELVHH
jgi:Rrf2 family protein